MAAATAVVHEGHSDAGREAVFLANTTRNVEQLPNSQAAALKTALNDGSIKVTCVDCGEEFLPGELGISCVLCEVCYEVAGIENEAQDGVLSGEEADKQIAELRATQGGGA